MKLQKKGQGIVELIVAIIIIVIIASIVLPMYTVVTEINNDIANDTTMYNETKDAMAEVQTRYPQTMDGIIALIVGLLFMGGLIAAYFADSHPVYMIFFIIIVVFLMVAGGSLSNYWDEYSGDAEYGSISEQFPITNFILDNFLLVIGVFGFSIVLVLYLKNRVIG